TLRSKSSSLHAPGETSVRIAEQADHACGTLGVTVELFQQLQSGQTRRERFRIEIGRHDDKCIVVGRTRWCARTHIEVLASGPFAADVLIGRLAGFTLCKS